MLGHWRDGSVHRELAMNALGPEFASQKQDVVTHICTPGLGLVVGRQNSRTCHPVGLAELVSSRFSVRKNTVETPHAGVHTHIHSVCIGQYNIKHTQTFISEYAFIFYFFYFFFTSTSFFFQYF